MADRSVVGWVNVAEFQRDPIASDSDDGKKIRQVENRALTKRKSKKPDKPTIHAPSQRQSGQQFRIDSELNSFTPPNQRNFNFRFLSNIFVQYGYFRRVQWRSSSNIRSGTRALDVAKEDTGVNIAPTPDTENELEGIKVDNETSN